MKRLTTYLCLLGMLSLAVSCSDFTDVQPKGKNLLSTTTELEMLLDSEFSTSSSDWSMMCGDLIYCLENVPNLISKPQKTRTSIILTWDEAEQDYMAELTTGDGDYSSFYGIIGTIANPVLARVDAAEGDAALKNQLKCEALVLRAYFHYLLVNKFAKAYNPATASQDPGIPYMTEDMDVAALAVKLTVAQVYEHILADLQEAIDLGGLPDVAVNRMRVNKPFAYAAKAMALLSMQRFDEAESVAREVLAMNDKVSNYNTMTTTYTGIILHNTYDVLLRTRLECEEDLFFTFRRTYYDAFTPYGWNRFEDGHATRDKLITDRMMYDFMEGMGNGNTIMGLDYTLTMDMESGWNGAGLKTTDMYLLVAEVEIRNGHYDEAMAALDKIRANRIDPALYEPLEGRVQTAAEAISRLKQTSHGENIFTVWNFINRKRWNQLPGWEETFTHDYNGQVFTLEPDSPLWIFPFPSNVTAKNPNMTQNYK